MLLVALNLRGAIAAVSPVLPQIRAELSLSASSAGLLTTLPVLCFAAVAPAAAWLGRRVGLERAILLGMLGIAVGTVLRVLGGAPVLVVGTLVVGAAITVGNVLVPVVAKRDFGARAGTVTGLYTAALAAGAAATAAGTAPLAAVTSWRTGLAAWALLAVIAAVVWHVAAGRRRPAPEVSGSLAGSELSCSLWRHPVAWAVALLLGAQSVAYYSVTAWLPTVLMEKAGLDLAAAGFAMSVFQVVGIAGTLVIPTVLTWRPQQSWLAVAVGAGWAVMVAGLLVWPTAWWPWMVVGGVAQGAGISLAFSVMVLRSHDAVVARKLSGMAQVIAYPLAALGPLAAGALYERFGGWDAALVMLLLVCAGMSVSGVVAGRNTAIGSAPAPVPRDA